jgi:uncharacterized tellurite resistance protein B-like protein
MLDRLHRLLTGGPPEAEPTAHSFEERQLAAAALMVEAATMDSTFDAAERTRIGELLQERFGLGADDAADLIAEAGGRSRRACSGTGSPRRSRTVSSPPSGSS